MAALPFKNRVTVVRADKEKEDPHLHPPRASAKPAHLPLPRSGSPQKRGGPLVANRIDIDIEAHQVLSELLSACIEQRRHCGCRRWRSGRGGRLRPISTRVRSPRLLTLRLPACLPACLAAILQASAHTGPLQAQRLEQNAHQKQPHAEP